MFGFGIDKKQVAHLAGIIHGLQLEFAKAVGETALEQDRPLPAFCDANLAVIYGFASAGADHMAVSDKVMLRALETYFRSNFSDGPTLMLRQLRLCKDTAFSSMASTAVIAAEQVNRTGNLSAPMRFLATQFIESVG